MTKRTFIKDFLEKKGNLTFAEYPFSEVDVAICAALSYGDYMASSVILKFDLWNDKIPLKAFNKHETIKLLSRRFLSGPLVFYNFFKAVLKTKRYEALRITKIMNYFDSTKNAQFYAMMYEIDDLRFVIYRGTDNSIPGWKEDFLTAIKDVVPSQKLALDYLNKVLEEEEKDVTIIGHSKGGNLAYYAFFNTNEENKKRVKICYNLDGNGFKNDSYNYEKYSNQILKIVPSDDVVGSIFDMTNNRQYVVSSSFTIFAHDVLTWIIDSKTENTFLRAKNLTRISNAYQVALNSWVQSLSDEDIHYFIDFIFMLVDVDKPLTIKDLMNSFNSNKRSYFKSIENYPIEQKKEIQKMCILYIEDFLKAYLNVKPKRNTLKITKIEEKEL